MKQTHACSWIRSCPRSVTAGIADRCAQLKVPQTPPGFTDRSAAQAGGGGTERVDAGGAGRKLVGRRCKASLGGSGLISSGGHTVRWDWRWEGKWAASKVLS